MARGNVLSTRAAVARVVNEVTGRHEAVQARSMATCSRGLAKVCRAVWGNRQNVGLLRYVPEVSVGVALLNLGQSRLALADNPHRHSSRCHPSLPPPARPDSSRKAWTRAVALTDRVPECHRTRRRVSAR